MLAPIVLLGLAAAAPAVSLELLDAGAEPRVSLAVAPKPGTVEVVSCDLSFTADVTNEGINLPPASIPSMHLTLRSEVLEVGNDVFRAAITIPSVKVGVAGESGDDVRKAAQEAMAPMTHLQGVVSLDRFGAPQGAEWSTTDGVQVDAALVSELERAVELMQVRRPQQAVGVGARWTLTRTGTDDLGFSVSDIETWTLTEVGEAGWTMELTSLQRAEVPQQVGPHTLKSHTGAAQGRAVLDPAHLHPSRVELGLTLRTRMLLEGAVNSTTTSTLKATVERKPAG